MAASNVKPTARQQEISERLESESLPDPVEEASQESFPASDPPEWTPMTGVGPPAHPRQDQVTERTRCEHDALLDAMHGLEAVLASAAPGREKSWARRVRKNLQGVADALARHVASAEAPDGVLAAMDQARPTLAHRVERLRLEHDDLQQRIRILLTQLEHHGDNELPSFADIRQRAAWLMSALRHHQAVETDLIFEALATDIGVGD